MNVLQIKNEVKGFGTFNKNLTNEIKKYNDSIHRTMNFEDNADNYLDLNRSDLPRNFLSYSFNRKTTFYKVSIKQAKTELLSKLFDTDIICLMIKIFIIH